MSLPEGNLLALIAAFVAAALLSLFGTYVVRQKAVQMGLVDRPDGVRRRHPNPVPRLGGISVMAAALTTAALVLATVPDTWAPLASPTVLVTLGLTGVAIWAVGLADDLVEFRAGTKLLLEVAIAVAAFAGGIRIEGLPFFGSESVLPQVLSLPLTVVWLVGVANAFNLIDGSDAVAGGAVLFASTSLAFVFLFNGNMAGAVVAFAVAGSVLGFLFFNFPPASIFLGDSGSLFLGYTLASLAVVTTHKASTAVAIAIPVVTFGLPLLDTALAVVRRVLRGDPIFKPDHGHIHHRLKEMGHSPRAVALMMFVISAAFASLALLLTRPVEPAVVMVFVVAGMTLWLGVQRLRIPELMEAQSMLVRGLRRRQRVATNVRLRSAAAQLKQAQCFTDVVEVLEGAFADGEFSRIELRFPKPLAGSERHSGVTKTDNGYRWTWENDRVLALRGSFTIQFRLRLPREEAEAELTLVREITSQPLATDLWLLAQELQPCLESSLARCAVVEQPSKPQPGQVREAVHQ